MDYKLIDMVNRLANRSPFNELMCKPITPECFGKSLGIPPLPPRIFSYNNASFPVRADLTIPDGKRIPLSRYRKRKQKR